MAPYQIAANGTEKAWGKTAIVERCCGKFRREWEKSTPSTKISLKKTSLFYATLMFY